MARMKMAMIAKARVRKRVMKKIYHPFLRFFPHNASKASAPPGSRRMINSHQAGDVRTILRATLYPFVVKGYIKGLWPPQKQLDQPAGSYNPTHCHTRLRP
jgi:hypothetical protein